MRCEIRSQGRSQGRSKMTPEEKVQRLINGATRSSWRRLEELKWEAGQTAYIEAYGMRYDVVDLPEGGYIVVEWDAHGNVIVV